MTIPEDRLGNEASQGWSAKEALLLARAARSHRFRAEGAPRSSPKGRAPHQPAGSHGGCDLRRTRHQPVNCPHRRSLPSAIPLGLSLEVNTFDKNECWTCCLRTIRALLEALWLLPKVLTETSQQKQAGLACCLTFLGVSAAPAFLLIAPGVPRVQVKLAVKGHLRTLRMAPHSQGSATSPPPESSRRPSPMEFDYLHRWHPDLPGLPQRRGQWNTAPDAA